MIFVTDRPIITRVAWNKADLRPKVERRAAELNKSLTDVMPKGYAIFAPSRADQSPSIAVLEAIAENLEWSLCQLLCNDHTEAPRIRPELIKMAVTAAMRAIPSDRSADLLPEAIVSALDMLQAYEQDQEPIDDRALAHIERSLRGLYRGR